MSFVGKAEILGRIRNAEAKVEAQVAEAEAKRKQLQAEGKRRALEKAEAAEEELSKEMDSRLSEARSRIDKRRNAILEEGTRRAEALKASAKRSAVKVRAFVLTEFERTVDV